MQEIWVDIEGWEGQYQYSNMLRVRSLDRVVLRSDGISRTFKGKILPVSKSSAYARVFLCTGRETIFLQLHKFFAEIFIPNPENKKYVNHKNGNKHDYSLSNLEWATKGEDLKHAYDTGLRKSKIGKDSPLWGKKYMAGRTGDKHHNSKLVLDTQTGIFYECVREAEEAKGIPKSSLSPMLRGVFKNRTSLIYA